jgi:hypothetical protein
MRREQPDRHALTATPQQRERVLALAKDFPRLWNSPTTTAQDRKRILRLIIKDVTVRREAGSRSATAHIRWQGGVTEEVSISIPPQIWKRQSCPEHILHRIRELAVDNAGSRIAEILNQQGLAAPEGGRFTRASVLETRRKYNPDMGNPIVATYPRFSVLAAAPANVRPAKVYTINPHAAGASLVEAHLYVNMLGRSLRAAGAGSPGRAVTAVPGMYRGVNQQ